MKPLLKKLAGETAIYGVSTIIGRTLNYLLVPLYTSIFLPGQYGIVTELYAYVAFLNIIYTYGLETGYFRFASEGIESEKKAYQNTITSILITSFLFSGIILILANPLANLIEYPGKENYIRWLAIILCIDAITAIPFAKLRWEKKAKQFATIKIINILLNIFFNIFFLIICPYLLQHSNSIELKNKIDLIYDPSRSVEYVFIANLLANLITLLILVRSFLIIKFNLSLSFFKKILNYSYPILLTGLAGMTNEMLSRILLKWRLPENFYPGKSNLDVLGIFGACYKLSIFMSLAIQAFKFAAEPFFFSQSQEKNSPHVFAEVMNWFIITCCIILLGISLNLDFIGAIFLRKEEYREALSIVPILLLGNLFLGVYYNLSTWFKLTDRTYFGTYFTIAGAVITILLNYLLIPIWGYDGSALATLICYAGIAITCYLYGQKYYPIPYKVAEGLAYIVTASLLIYCSSKIYISNPFFSILFHNLLLIMYIACIVLIKRKKRLKI